MELLIVLAVVIVVPTSLYFLHDRGRGASWGLVAAGEEVRGSGAYREARVRTWKRGAAPISVRIAAWSSFFLGQMILPGGLAALVGLFATIATLTSGRPSAMLIVHELSAPTGLVVAARLLDAGTAMLSRAADAAPKARLAARWAIGHNLALLAGLGLAAALQPREAIAGALTAVYVLVSIGHALLVRRAAGALEAYAARQEEDPAPIAAELQILGEVR